MAVAEKLPEVDLYLDALDHTRKADIIALRELILAAVPGLTETIKGNAPSYGRANADRITMRLHPGNRVQLILHRGAKAGADDLFRFEDPAKQIAWAAPDRGVMTFKDRQDLDTRAEAVAEVLRRWVAMTTR
jgi:hypothetical protein